MLKKKIFILLFPLLGSYAWGQSNAIKTTLYFTRVDLAYERAFTYRISAGAEAEAHWGTFQGFSPNLFGRYYFKEFTESSFFLEYKLIYGHYFPIAYSYADNFNNTYGQHTANLNYLSNGFSLGYRVFLTTEFFIEFIVGVRAGVLLKGINDNYIIYTQTPANMGNAFYTIGPGEPVYSRIKLGITF